VSSQNKLAQELIQFTIDQAKEYLASANEFYPFGSIVNENGQLQPFSIYTGDDYPSLNKYLKELSNEMKNRYESYSIGINSIVTNKVGIKMDAIQVKLVIDLMEYEDCFLPYEFRGNDIIYYDLFVPEK